jgi:hypothetical protein
MNGKTNQKFILIRQFIQKIGIIIGFLLLLLQLVSGLRAIQENQLLLVRPWLLLPTIFILCVATGIQIIAWIIIMRGFRIRISLIKAIRGYILTFLPRYIPGTFWSYLSRAQWLNQDFRIPFTISNISSLLEVSLAMTASLLIIGIYELCGLSTSQQIFFIILGSVLGITIWKFIGYLWGKIKVKVQEYTGNFMLVFKPYIWIIGLAILTINLLLHGFAVFLISTAFGINLSPLTFRTFFLLSGIFSLAWLIGFLVLIIPSGLGIRELVFSYLIASEFTINFGQASTISLTRIFTILAELIWVGVVLILKQKSGVISSPPLEER